MNEELRPGYQAQVTGSLHHQLERSKMGKKKQWITIVGESAPIVSPAEERQLRPYWLEDEAPAAGSVEPVSEAQRERFLYERGGGAGDPDKGLKPPIRRSPHGPGKKGRFARGAKRPARALKGDGDMTGQPGRERQ